MTSKYTLSPATTDSSVGSPLASTWRFRMFRPGHSTVTSSLVRVLFETDAESRTYERHFDARGRLVARTAWHDGSLERWERRERDGAVLRAGACDWRCLAHLWPKR